jgi:hypothetical protein
MGCQLGKFQLSIQSSLISEIFTLVLAKHLLVSWLGHFNGRRNRKQEERNAQSAEAIGRLQRNSMWILQSWNGHEHVLVVGIKERQGDDARS